MMFRQRVSIIFALAFAANALANSSTLDGAEAYGHLRGRFVYDGEPPKPKLLTITGDEKAEIEKLKLVDESLIVHPENRGVANVVVYLHVAKGEAPPQMHPSYRIDADAPDEKRTRTMSMLDTRYVPHVLLVRTDEIYLSVSDTVRAYHPNLNLAENHQSCTMQPPGESQTHEFRKPERMPVKLSDSIYPWMQGWVMIQDHPYMAVADADGRFEIRHIPAGERTFRFWHEKIGFIAQPSVGMRKAAGEKGLATFNIRADETIDLGDILMVTSSFK